MYSLQSPQKNVPQSSNPGKQGNDGVIPNYTATDNTVNLSESLLHGYHEQCSENIIEFTALVPEYNGEHSGL